MGTQGETATTHLRAVTRTDHETVDAAFGGFALGTPEGYRDFLTAHARILPLAERLIDPASLIGEWRGRTRPLLDDLHAMGGEVPADLDFALPQGEAPRWGALYVMEGSRLGGAVLAKLVPEGLPAAYLGSRHEPGAWRSLLQRLDEADEGPDWRRDAAQGARALFGAYRNAAQLAGHD